MASQEKIKADKELAIIAAEVLYHYKLIARSVGRDEDTLAIWRKDDADFSDRLEIGRTEFIKKQMGKARPEFLLERLEKEMFAPPKQEVEHTGDNPIRVLLEAYGVTEGENDDRKIDEAVQGTSDSEA